MSHTNPYLVATTIGRFIAKEDHVKLGIMRLDRFNNGMGGRFWTPLFFAGLQQNRLFHADRRTLLRSRILLVGLIIVISAVRMLPQPWRGIVDGGVVAGLAWGLAAALYLFVAALRGRSLPVDSLPEPAEVAVG